MRPARDITLSVVSHRQNALVNLLLEDIEQHCAPRVRLIVTENVPDPVALETSSLSCPVELIVNSAVKGFGANHNSAFRRWATPYFCVVNPDVRLPTDPFPALLESLRDPRVGVVGPLVRSPSGAIEDSARRFPTVGSLLLKALGSPSGPEYPINCGPVQVDWVAGIFMLFRGEAFAAVGGFDEGFFLYYEDVDLCLRLGLSKRITLFDPRSEVVHDARRSSRRDVRLARHHMGSLLRYLRRRSAR